MRVYNVRCGHAAEHDSVAPRFARAPENGLNAGRAFADYLPDVRRKYYEEMGWDESGVPRRETLKRLGLEHIVIHLPSVY
ncbi:MAG: hypothetical protein HYY30_06960 [Chloroflexi bacterium]|nr:hypothetical protein [Chloroflexota bacterium]